MDFQSVLRAFQSQPPVDVLQLAAALKLKVFSDSLDPGISGCIVRRPDLNPEGQYIIVVNSNDALVRQRFTVAHEIAHYVLHKDSIGDGISEDAMHRAVGLSNWQEVEANKLAADILMPYHLINLSVQNGAHSIEDLARTFSVSPVAMGIRLGLQS